MIKTTRNRDSDGKARILYNLNQNEFCIDRRILPSIFVIGVQKCGTTTLDGVMSRFPQLSHGRKKEHHFFGHEKYNNNYTDYLNGFTECNTEIIKSYDATPNYANPNKNAAEDIKQFYEELGISLNKIMFIAIVCPNSRRISSVYHRSNFLLNRPKQKLNPNIKTINKWFDWILKHQDQDILEDSPLSRGFYDDIFAKYFELFPKSTFLLIDSQYALAKMQELGDFLATELNLPKQHIPDIHRNKGHAYSVFHTKKENLTELNLKKMHLFYSKHEQNFLELLKLNHNAKTFPMNNFLVEWP